MGNTRTHWSLNSSTKNKQSLAWNTPHLYESDLYKKDKHTKDDLRKYLAVKNFKEDFEQVGNMRVYVVSVVKEETECIKNWFGKVGSKVYVLPSSEFYNDSEGGYDTLGPDRAANQFGSRRVKGEHLDGDIPSLVIDCGTCMTFTSSGEGGFGIRAGPIMPGIQVRGRTGGGK